MVAIAARNIQRFAHNTRKPQSTMAKSRWRDRAREKLMRKARTPGDALKKAQIRDKKKVKVKVFAEALGEVKKIARTLHERFGDHCADYYYRQLLQLSRAPKNERKINTWNAFVSVQTKAMNDALPEGELRLKANNHAPKIKELWDSMTPAQREESTRDKLTELEEQREMKKYALQNVPINAFHDARATLTSIQTTIENVHHRTGTEFVLIAVRATHEDLLRPYVLTTSSRIDDFFQATTQQTPANFSLKMEAFCLTGLNGVVRNYQQEIYDLKHKASSIVTDKLRECASPTKISRMYYQNFDKHITENYRIVLEGWPLSTGLKTPCDITSRVELQLIINAFTTGTARFCRLEQEEFNKFMAARTQTRQQAVETPAQTQAVTPSGGTASEDTSTAGPATEPLPAEPASPATSTPPSPAATSSSLAATPSSPVTTATPLPLSVDSTNASTSVFRVNIVGGGVAKKPRKPRADKGTKRGPNARTKAARRSDVGAPSPSTAASSDSTDSGTATSSATGASPSASAL